MATVNSLQAPLAVANLHGPDKNVARRHLSIDRLLDGAMNGLGAFNELNPADRSFIKAQAAKRKLQILINGLNGAVWDPTVIRKVGKPRVKKIMTGGHVGADGVATAKRGDDDRRVGPSRFCVYLPLQVIAVSLDFEFDFTHLMARAFSVHTWRQRLFFRSVSSLAAGVIDANGILVGDMNDPHQINLPGVADVPVPAPADMGRQHYTQIHRWGQHIYISGVKDVSTPSDHDMLLGKITFYRLRQDHLHAVVAKPPAKNPLPRPGTRGVNWRKYGSPVAFPWAGRSRAWRRRRKALWIRILKWRAAYRRRL